MSLCSGYLEDSEETPPISAELASSESVQFQLTSLSALQDLQSSCPEVKKIKSGDKPKSATFSMEQIDGHELLCEMSSTNPRPFVPKPLRLDIMTSLHSMDHLGIKSTLARVASEYYWPSVNGDVKSFVSHVMPA